MERRIQYDSEVWGLSKWKIKGVIYISREKAGFEGEVDQFYFDFKIWQQVIVGNVLVHWAARTAITYNNSLTGKIHNTFCWKQENVIMVFDQHIQETSEFYPQTATLPTDPCEMYVDRDWY